MSLSGTAGDIEDLQPATVIPGTGADTLPLQVNDHSFRYHQPAIITALATLLHLPLNVLKLYHTQAVKARNVDRLLIKVLHFEFKDFFYFKTQSGDVSFGVGK